MKSHSTAEAEFENPDAKAFSSNLFEPSICHTYGLCVCKGKPGELALWLHKNILAFYKPFLRSANARTPRAAAAATTGSDTAPADGITAIVPGAGVAVNPGVPKPAAKPNSQPKRKTKAPKKPGRILMEQGYLVLCLEKGQRQRSLHEFESGWGHVDGLPADAPPLLGLECEPDRRDQSGAKQALWFHIGFANYSTFNFTVCKMFVDEDDVRMLDHISEPCPHNIVRLKAGNLAFQGSMSDSFKLSFAAFHEDIDDWECEWFASFYSIFTNIDRVQMKPCWVEVVPCGYFPKMRVWKAWILGIL